MESCVFGKLLHSSFLDLCEAVNTPTSLGAYLKFKYAHSELASASIDPAQYNDVQAFFGDYSVVNLLKKYEGLTTGIDTRSVALDAFNKSEETCRSVNADSRSYRATGQFRQIEPSMLLKVQEIIRRVWGSPTFADLFNRCSWGPGSTSTLTGDRATTEGKMSELPISVTPTALPYIKQILRKDLAWMRHLVKHEVVGEACLMPLCFQLTSWSKLLTVPKNAKTDRVIAAEPTANIFLQLGVGAYLRSRLRSYGVDLNSQVRNQELAQKAVSSSLATLDLSAASDSIAVGLCKVLLPPEMFDVLYALRTPNYKLGEEVHEFHKFSSMGNGYTFPLQSLLFWAAAKAVCESSDARGPIGVYGDDIIVPQSAAKQLIALLSGFGFKVNEDKSFISGRFFESCGKHYFDGVDVTPIYQKRPVDNALEMARCANRFYELAYNRPDLDGLFGLKRIHKRLLRQVPQTLKCYVAPAWVEGDGFFRVPVWTGRSCLARGIQIHFMKPRVNQRKTADGGLYAYMLRKSHDECSVCSNQRESISDFARRGADVTDGFATLGFVSPRPRGRVVDYTHGRRWVFKP